MLLPRVHVETSALLCVVVACVRYSVPIKGQKEEKVLLNAVFGAAVPGQLVALMGATGGVCVCACG